MKLVSLFDFLGTVLYSILEIAYVDETLSSNSQILLIS